MVEEHGVSHRQACKAVSMPRSSYQYQPKQKDDTPIIEQLKKLVGETSLHWLLAVLLPDAHEGLLLES
ncbi:integrase catalytic subunit [Flammeovirgaceae bacterium 311]|nr:integrase catalytic subunit [Flammeovirgaceae bacterium 311]